MIFQSTPSVGRETDVIKLYTELTYDFNPLPPWGGRHTTAKSAQNLESISIHSLRGEGDEFNDDGLFSNSKISIHSLRGEGDLATVNEQVYGAKISIHSLRGEGDKSAAHINTTTAQFQSTPSVGRETRPTKIKI